VSTQTSGNESSARRNIPTWSLQTARTVWRKVVGFQSSYGSFSWWISSQSAF